MGQAEGHDSCEYYALDVRLDRACKWLDKNKCNKIIDCKGISEHLQQTGVLSPKPQIEPLFYTRLLRVKKWRIKEKKQEERKKGKDHKIKQRPPQTIFTNSRCGHPINISHTLRKTAG